MIIDQYSGAALAVVSARAPSAITGVVTLSRAVHTGDIFGIPSKIVGALL